MGLARVGVLGLLVGALALGGCKTDEQKICKKMVSLVEKAGKPIPSEAEFEKCVEDFKTRLETCEDKKAVVSCYEDAEEVVGTAKCKDACKKSPAPGTSTPGAEAPAPGAAPASADGCPHSADCMNRCRSTCEGQHGAMMDTAKMGECARAGGKPDECVKKASNEPSRLCFLSCRGLPAN